jgi:glycosyltransferase involved in cell wall biosynthesis
MKTHTFSVIIPTYNEADCIADCLDALQNQVVAPDEIIVVDNNSTDSTVDIVQRYPQVQLLREDRQGQLYARQVGFDAATSDYIATIDADCQPHEDWVHYMKNRLSVGDIDALSGYVSIESPRFLPFAGAVFNWFEYQINYRLLGHYPLFGSNMVITQVFWQRVRGKLQDDTSLWEDYDMACLGAAAGLKIGCLRAPLVQMSTRRGTQSYSQAKQYFSGWHRTIKPYHPHAYRVARVLEYWVVFGLALARPFITFNQHTKRVGRFLRSYVR